MMSSFSPLARAAMALLVAAAACSTPEASETAGGTTPASAAGDVTPVARSAHAPVTLSDSTVVTVYKSPTCGCCRNWVEHMEKSGFKVVSIDTSDVNPVKQSLGVASELGSCHTATVGGYVIEGHVPAEDVKRLLAERPKVTGLAVPGMPMGSPGMEGPISQAYDVIAFDKAGGRSVFAKH